MKRFFPAIAAAAAFGAFVVLLPDAAPRAYAALGNQIGTMLLVIPPIFLLLGLLDVWVPRETFIRYLGDRSGFRGKAIAFALGSAAAGPLYGAFPIAAVLMKKGAAFDNVLVFIGAWSTTKVPMLLFEMRALGVRFALSRLLVDLAGITLIALAMKALIPKEEVDRIYEAARER